MQDQNRRTLATYTARLRDRQVLGTMFRNLLELADGEHHNVYLQRCPRRNSPGSMHVTDPERERFEIWLDPHAFSPAEEALVCSLAHEVGHVLDPPSEEDKALQKGTPEYRRRELEREKTAWAWARDELESQDGWDLVQEHFESQAAKSIKAYEERLPVRRG